MSSYWGVNRNIDVTKSSRLALIFWERRSSGNQKNVGWVVEAFLFFIHSVSAIHWKSGCVVLTTAKASVRHRGWRYNSFLYLLLSRMRYPAPFGCQVPGKASEYDWVELTGEKRLYIAIRDNFIVRSFLQLKMFYKKHLLTSDNP